MIEIKCGFANRQTITLYESIHELSSQRWKEFNKYSFLDSGIGSTMQDFHQKIGKLWQLVEAEKHVEAKQEMKNINRNVFHALQSIDIKSFCFALFVHSINEKVKYDISQGGLEKTIKEIDKTGVKQSQVESTLSELKKKLIPS